jgi:hypothetical protein
MLHHQAIPKTGSELQKQKHINNVLNSNAYSVQPVTYWHDDVTSFIAKDLNKIIAAYKVAAR